MPMMPSSIKGPVLSPDLQFPGKELFNLCSRACLHPCALSFITSIIHRSHIVYLYVPFTHPIITKTLIFNSSPWNQFVWLVAFSFWQSTSLHHQQPKPVFYEDSSRAFNHLNLLLPKRKLRLVKATVSFIKKKKRNSNKHLLL